MTDTVPYQHNLITSSCSGPRLHPDGTVLTRWNSHDAKNSMFFWGVNFHSCCRTDDILLQIFFKRQAVFYKLSRVQE